MNPRDSKGSPQGTPINLQKRRPVYKKQVGFHPRLKLRFTTLHRLSKDWPPDWMQSCTLASHAVHELAALSGVTFTRTSPMLFFTSVTLPFNSTNNYYHVRALKIQGVGESGALPCMGQIRSRQFLEKLLAVDTQENASLFLFWLTIVQSMKLQDVCNLIEKDPRYVLYERSRNFC